MQGSCEAHCSPLTRSISSNTMSRHRKHVGNMIAQLRSESLSSDDAALLGRAAKARKSNIYDAVAGKQVQSLTAKDIS
jgi:hypothetical protein